MLFHLTNQKNQIKKTQSKDLIKKPSQKTLVKKLKSKMNCPKWHYGQVAQVGKKDHVGGFFY